ncbi:MAG: pectin acetylesterase-family hydrolase [Bdellovibrionota bacterium]|nr:pectin acetylesterase-family hydrolase [Bdellovibrionota bacterium]
MIRKSLLMAALMCFAFTAQAAKRSFQSVEIPNAFCGDGSPYKVFLENRSSSRLAFKFQGGGACWSHFTCFTIGTTRGSIPEQASDDEGFASDSMMESPVADYSFVLFPYCTGDVHLGRHTASYKDKTYYHNGYNNIMLALNHLVEEGYVNFDSLDKFAMYGESAGAIGALYHSLNVTPYLSSHTEKRLIVDAPGLHFGSRFWHKFSDALFYDLSSALLQTGVKVDKDNGKIAQAVPNVCRMLPDWQVATIQGTRDSIMSMIFGNISPANHEEAVLGEGGISQLTLDPNDNCVAFVPDTRVHVLLTKNRDLDIDADGKTVIEFAHEFIRDGAGRNYVDDYWARNMSLAPNSQEMTPEISDFSKEQIRYWEQ